LTTEIAYAPEQIAWRPNPGPQTKATASNARELLYGGSAGGGKSNWLVGGATRYIHEPTFRGILFRNTYNEIQKISDQEARPIYEALGGKVKGDSEWNFPSGARIYLAYMASDKDAFAHQGAAYQYIGFDELTHYSLFQYRYLFSRLRGKNGIPLEIRATCNPEPGWVKERWAPWVDRSQGYDGILAESGQKLWYVTDEHGVESYVDKDTPDAISRAFVRAKLSDNPFLGPEYASQLKSMDPIQRARLLDGDWEADYTPGLLFRRSMFRIVPHVPAKAIRVRSWDLAATEEKLVGANAFKPGRPNDPDYTVGTLYGWAPGFGFFIEHIERVRGRPEVARQAIQRMAEQDAAKYGRGGVTITIPEDPGSAGITVFEAYVSMLAGYRVVKRRPDKRKVLRAGPVSSTAELIGISMLAAPWNELFLQEAEQFPKGKHDDQIDTLSDAHLTIAEMKATNKNTTADYSSLPDFS